MKVYQQTRTKVYLTPTERLEYNGYLAKIETATTSIELETYHRIVKRMIEKALKRQTR